MRPSVLSTSRRFLLWAAVAALLTMTSCLASGQSTDARLDDPRGEASYYGDTFAGQTTASGEAFDPEALTAAHPSLPFGTRVRVTRTGGEHGRAVTVRINDRGPFADNRIIDLSEAAARQIGMIDEGVVEVRIEVLELPPDAKATSERTGVRRAGGRW
ncbi:MAG: septal ring lytic transglycosylase RlpA family protein [Salinivenus sp.]